MNRPAGCPLDTEGSGLLGRVARIGGRTSAPAIIHPVGNPAAAQPAEVMA